MIEIQAPTIKEPYLSPTIFLAGGITGCPDWQAEAIEMLKDRQGSVFNPRRDNFDVNDPTAAPAQIRWEHEHLRKADMILFWFPRESICPIVLYELGVWGSADKPIAIGTHIEYPRRLDVVEQMKLVRPGQLINAFLDDVVTELVR